MNRSPEEQVKLAQDLTELLNEDFDLDLSALDLLDALASLGFELVRSPEGDAIATAAYFDEIRRDTERP